MKRHATWAVVTAAFFAGACSDREPIAPPVPELAIKDSRNTEQAGFYFGFPITKLSAEGDIPAVGFNPGLSPTIRFYDCGPATAIATTGCHQDRNLWDEVGTPLTLTSGTHLLDRIFVLPQLKRYLGLWNTKPLTLDAARIYHLEVLVGGHIVGSADVDLVRRLRELPTVDRENYVALLADGILPIPFWIGENVLCEEGTASCTSETVEFGPAAPATTIEFATPDEVIRVDFPAGTTVTTSQGEQLDEVTFNLELCDGIDVDLPLIGQCVRITSLVPGATATSLQLSNPVLISLCSLHLPHEDQEALITLHQQDGRIIRALPHVHPNCPEPIPAGEVGGAGGDGGGLLAAWRGARNALTHLFVPRPLYANSRVVVLNQGGGGETDFFGQAALQSAGVRVQSQAPVPGPGVIVTDFQFALPAKMEAPDLSPRSGPVGSILSFAVALTDARGASLLDTYDRPARVTFTVTDAEDETITEQTVNVAAGVATFDWTALEGTFTVTASGRGIASPSTNGPIEDDPDGEGPISEFDPFWPDFDVPSIAERDDILLETGAVTFTVVNAEDWSEITAGNAHSCGVLNDAVYCWGQNVFGQLGDGGSTNSPVPILVESPEAGPVTFVALTANGNIQDGANDFAHTCGLTTSAEIYCWGHNALGQLGNGTTSNSSVPVSVNAELTFLSVDAGLLHTCAVATGGGAYCWGLDGGGQLGDGDNSFTSRNLPNPVASVLSFSQVSGGASFTCGLSEGAAYCWGSNTFGQLGRGDNNARDVPVLVTGEHTFAQVSAGESHACGVTSAGDIYCWGSDQFDQLGTTTDETCTIGEFSVSCSRSPVAIAPPATGAAVTWAAVQAGSFHTCALTAGGAAYCWGANFSGQLGIGQFTGAINAPVAVTGNLTFARLDAGVAHNCAISAEARAYCWGHNDFGQLGNGEAGGPTAKAAPTLVTLSAPSP